MERELQVEQIISGGQTGVDRAALDVAIHLDIPHGGWCPRNRAAEDGPIPETYTLQETREADYAIRTEKNVKQADGTLILYWGEFAGGTKLTWQLAQRYRRHCLLVDLSTENSPSEVVEWLTRHKIRVLNVAGPRESSSPGIGQLAERFLLSVFR